MQNFFLGQYLTEIQSGESISYILEKEDMFYDIGFRVMKNQGAGTLFTCHRLKYNGKIKLVYFTDDAVPLSECLANMDTDRTAVVVANLYRAMEEIQENGFLNISCIDCRLQRIYVDESSLEVKLIYLPLNTTSGGITRGTWKGKIQEQINEILHANQSVDAGMLQKRIENVSSKKQVFREQTETAPETLKLAFCSMNGETVIPITEDDFIIGKSAEKVSGVIIGNPAISRIHCKIVHYVDSGYYIMDLNSANGTFVNGEKILPEQMVRIQEGTRIKLANQEFVLRGMKHE